MGFLETFALCAQQALSQAQAEARRFKHPYLGTEHLLLGLIGSQEGIAGRVFGEFSVSLEQARATVERTLGHGRHTNGQEPELSASAQQVIDFALEEARKLNQAQVSSEHLLLGLIRKDEGVAVGILKIMGVNPEQMRIAVLGKIRPVIAPAPTLAPTPPSATPYLDALGTDLTELAAAGRLDAVIGRQQEIERIIQILSRRGKNNPALIGKAGVGKTAVVEGLAQRIVAGQVPESLRGKRLVALDVSALVAGTKYRGQFEERLKNIVDEIHKTQCILFIDEFHLLVGAGGAEGSLDAANILKPALARGEQQTIGATTFDEYRKYIESDPALERRFQPVVVDEPSAEDTIQILRRIKGKYESFHKVQISDDVVRAAVNLAVRYIPDRFLPDKAIDLIDEAAARVRINHASALESLGTALRSRDVPGQPDIAYDDHSDNVVAAARARANERPHMTEGDLAEIVGMWTGIPVKPLQGDEMTRLLKMDAVLRKRVIGQPVAIEAVTNALWRAYAGLTNAKRPIASFIFLGPTGVGKTELAKVLAEFMFGSEDYLIRFDMTEFQESHAVSRLIGSPPGYVGYGEGGQLTEAVRRRPYSIVLFDEIEKAHSDIYNLLLQVLDEGVLSDSQGRRVDFRNTIILLTSNIGTEQIRRATRLGFGAQRAESEPDVEEMQRRVEDALKVAFRPELINRLDAKIIFQPLGAEHIQEIARKMMKEVQTQLKERGIELEVHDDAYALLAEQGYDPEYGARPLRRTITKLIEDKLSRDVLTGRFSSGDTVIVDTWEQTPGSRTLRLRPATEVENDVRSSAMLNLCVITIHVTDMDQAVDFYCNKLGFAVRSRKFFPYIVELLHQDIPLVLYRVAEALHINYPHVAHTVLGLQTEDLAATLQDLRVKGVELVFDQPQEFPGGIYSAIRDPFGNVHELIEARG